ncbi:MAG: MFS transporter [Caulobacteraceae bacterium]
MTQSLSVSEQTVPEPLPGGARARILFYLSALTFLVTLGAPYLGLFDVPVSFILKNRLHLAAHQIADFKLFAAVPLYLSFLFGFARDTINPMGRRDRGFLILFGAATAALFALAAVLPVSQESLLIAVVLITCAYLFVASAQNGLTSVIGQQHVMSGQVSAVWNVVGSLPLIAAFLVGGILSGRLETMSVRQAITVLFLIGAAVMAANAAFGLWRPRAVFDHLHAEKTSRHRLDDMRRLLRHWPVYPALLIWVMWNFAPGAVTPLQFFLQNTLHATDAQWGEWNALFVTGFLPTYVIYGLVCQRFALKWLLLVGTIIAVPQMVPLLLIHSVNGALIAAFFIGVMGGLNSAAYIDLIIRSSPPGLQGTVMMMQVALYWIASRFGDVLGTRLYDHYRSFTVCVVAITVVYALILPALLMVPKRLTATPDGEVPEGGFGEA